MRNLRFLIVDDSAMARRLIVSVVRAKLGVERVLQAADGREALLILDKNPVDLIISDWSMGKVNGDELLSYVRRNERLRHIPFIMVTSNAHRESILAAIQLGVTQYLVKPFTPAELEQKIRSSWNAAAQRRTERYSDLPPHQATLDVQGTAEPATLLNLSLSGALLRLRHSEAIGLYRDFNLSLAFSEAPSGREWSLPAVPARSVRLESDDPGQGTCLLALEFQKDALGPQAGQQLASLIEWLGARGPAIIDS